MTPTTGSATSAERPTRMAPIAAAATIATALEWFDFFIYTTAASLVLGKLFFPTLGGVEGTLASFATLAVGFLARPVGGIVAGHLGDRWGRKPTLVLALVFMGVSTFGIGLLPTYATAGALAPILLIVLRVVQGLGVGAQWGGAALLLTEHAPVRRRGFYGSFVQVGAIGGSILGNLVYLALTAWMTDSAFESWGWRVPFLTGLVLILIGLFLQRRIEDTPVFQKLREDGAGAPRAEKPPLVAAIRGHWKQILQAAGAFMVVNTAYYIFISGILSYGTGELKMGKSTILAIVLGAGATQLVTMPLMGLLSDRMSRRKLYLAGTVLLSVWAFPMFLLVDTRNPLLIFVGLAVGFTFHSMMYGPQAALYAEMFSARVRYSGASLGYQIASIFAGGLAPFIMTALLAATGSSLSVSVYIFAMGVITFVAVFSIRESFQRDLYA
jgi:MFS family permease